MWSAAATPPLSNARAVDDEPVIASAVRNYLIRQGYDVDSASELA